MKMWPTWMIPDPAFPRPALGPKGLGRGGSNVQLVAWCLQARLDSGAQCGARSVQLDLAMAISLHWPWKEKTQVIELAFSGSKQQPSFGLWPKSLLCGAMCVKRHWALACLKLGPSGCSTQLLSFVTVKASTMSNSFRYFLSWSCCPA